MSQASVQYAQVVASARITGERLDSFPISGLDRIVLAMVTLAIYLEIAVSFEPAPVDLILIAVLALALVLGKWSSGNYAATPVAALGLFLLANAVSLVNANEPALGASYFLITLYLVASWFLLVGLSSYYGDWILPRLVNAYLAAGIISAVLGVAGYLHLVPFSDMLLLNGRSRGLFKDCNVYGPFLVPVALLALNKVGQKARLLSMCGQTATFLVAAAAMLLSFSRACWINAALALLVFSTLQVLRIRSAEARFQRVWQLGLTVAISVVAGLMLMQMPAVSTMMDVRVSSNGLQSYDRVRFGTQELAFQSALDHPLGIGPGQSEPVFLIATHSMYLRILSENGIVALLAFLLFIGSTMARSLRLALRSGNRFAADLNTVVFACIAGHLVNSGVIDTVHWRHIWFLYALPWCYREGAPSRTVPAAFSLSLRAPIALAGTR